MARQRKSKFSLVQKILIILEAGIEISFSTLMDLGDLFAYHSERWGWSAKEELYTIQAFAKAIARLKGEGLVQEEKEQGKKELHLTHRGELAINWLTPYLEKPQGKWDGKWYLVVFDVPEKIKGARDLLRRKLYELDYGQIQKSVFISPYDSLKIIKKLAQQNQMGDYIRTMVVERIDVKEELISKAWNWEVFRGELKDFINQCHVFKRRKKQPLFEKKELEIKLTEILKKDPSLPMELVPKDFLAIKKEALKIYQDL